MTTKQKENKRTLKTVHTFRESMSLRPAAESLQQGWQEAILGQTQPIQNLLDSITSLKELELTEERKRNWRQIKQNLNTLAEQWAPVIATIQKTLADFAPKLITIFEKIQKLPDDIREVLYALTNRGWYFSAEMGISFLSKLHNEFQLENSTNVDNMLQLWIESETQNIMARAISRFPAREKIIRSAIAAHVDGKYELSIPIILIQIEGMCQDEFNTKFYPADKGIPKTKQLAESLTSDSFTRIFLLPLCIPSGLTASKDYRSEYPEALNRHEIIHGTDISYPTQINSLKVLSLLDYLVTVVKKD